MSLNTEAKKTANAPKNEPNKGKLGGGGKGKDDCRIF